MRRHCTVTIPPPYRHRTFTIPSQYRQCTITAPGGTVDSAIAYSYNSINWTAFGQHSSPTGVPTFFPNEPHTPSAAQVYPNTLLDRGDHEDLLIHASASTHQHGYYNDSSWSSLLTYHLRRDGFTFAAVADTASDGYIRTRLLEWQAGDLLLNADCTTAAAATVTVSLMDQSGAEIPGYSAQDAIPFSGDSTNATVVWRDGRRMGAIRGKAVAIVVKLRGGARVYSLRGGFTWSL